MVEGAEEVPGCNNGTNEVYIPPAVKEGSCHERGHINI